MPIQSCIPDGSAERRSLKKCLLCGSIGVEPFPEEEVLNEYYQEYAVAAAKNNRSTGGWSRRTVLKQIQEVIRELRQGRVLDVGCGDGALLSLLPETFEKFGIDVSPEACAMASERKISTFCSPFISTVFPHKFDIVIAIDVVEHFAKPREAIRHMSEIVAPGGYLIIETGNANSFSARSLGPHWSYTAVFGHLCALSPSALRMITSDKGMETLCMAPSCHRRAPLLTVAYRNFLAYGFHMYCELYDCLRPSMDRISFFRSIYDHSPPQAPRRDHIIYVGRKRKVGAGVQRE